MDIPLDRLEDPSHSLRLVALDEGHLPALRPLFEDLPTIRLYLPTLARPMNEAQLRGMLADWHDATSGFVFVILHEDAVAGVCNLEGVDWTNRSSEIGIALLPGAPRGHGLARSAVRLLLGFAFREMGLHRMQARIQEGNDASQHLFESLGFHRDGVMREAVFRSGEWKALNLYSLLEGEFRP